MKAQPQALSDVPTALWPEVHGVMSDIDDTLTREGAVEPAARAALQALRDAALPVIAITGRPLGWSLALARNEALTAVVAENGAVALVRDGDALRTEFAQDARTRAANAVRLRDVAACVLREVPGATLARDSAGRVTDIAIDHGEFAHLDAAAIAHVVAILRSQGMQCSVSSIHVNGWFGSHDKLSGARWIVQRLFGRALDAERERWVYVGDSTNDQALFAYFALSVGVANLRDFAAQLHTWPAYITAAERGAGFAEVARAIVAGRAS